MTAVTMGTVRTARSEGLSSSCAADLALLRTSSAGNPQFTPKVNHDVPLIITKIARDFNLNQIWVIG